MKLIEFTMLAILLNLMLAGLPVIGLSVGNLTGNRAYMGSEGGEDIITSGSSFERIGADGGLDGCYVGMPDSRKTLACNIQLEGAKITVDQGSVESQKTFIDNLKLIINGITTFFDMFGSGVLNPGQSYISIMNLLNISDFYGSNSSGINFVVVLINTIMYALYGMAAVQLLTGRDLRSSQ